jgi:hypothetical protein
MLNKLRQYFLKKNIVRKEIMRRNEESDLLLYKQFKEPTFTLEEFSLLWGKIADILKLNGGKLRVEDRFDVEIDVLDPWLFDGYISEIQDLFIEKKVGDKGTNDFKIITLKDYVVNYFKESDL